MSTPTITPTVYYNRSPQFIIGPLGIWDVGERTRLEDGTEIIVGSVDADGAAIAWTVENMEQRAETMDEALGKVSAIRSTAGMPQNKHIMDQMQNVIAKNRQRYRG